VYSDSVSMGEDMRRKPQVVRSSWSIACLAFFGISLFGLEIPAGAEEAELFKDLNTRPNSAAGQTMAASSNLLFFAGVAAEHGVKRGSSDGTAPGTSFLQDLNPGPGDSFPRNFASVVIGGTEITFFVANTDDLGSELWRTDGTSAGTFPIDIV